MLTHNHLQSGQRYRVRALRALVVGRNNRAAVRKGDITIVTVLAPLPFSNVPSLRVQPTVDGMGETYTSPHNIDILGPVQC